MRLPHSWGTPSSKWCWRDICQGIVLMCMEVININWLGLEGTRYGNKAKVY